MPRQGRKNSKTKVYHVILRGIDKQDIFFCEEDYYKFLDILKETKEKYQYDIYSYCLMSNHIHIVVYDKNDKLSKIMQKIGISYSFYVNRKYNRIGHLFQNRFLSKNIEDREYLKMVCRYIHQNPLKAGIARTEDYKWSSYNEYIKKQTIINPRMLLLIFSKDKKEAKREFQKFHNIQSNNIADFIEYEMKEKITDEQALKYICELVGVKNIHEILELDIEKRNQIIVKIKKVTKITNSQISRVLGLNRKVIERVVSNWNLSLNGQRR